jgi:hypothetical protein
MTKRKGIPPKVKLKVFKRDNYTCRLCSKSPATYPELVLEVDHIKPVSEGGSNEIDNLQTLCIMCNRGKGNDSSLNITTRNRIDILLNRINPNILKEIEENKRAKIVANDTDFQELVRLNDLCNSFKVDVIPNTIIGYQAGYGMGIYTIEDYGGSKVNFILTVL